MAFCAECFVRHGRDAHGTGVFDDDDDDRDEHGLDDHDNEGQCSPASSVSTSPENQDETSFPDEAGPYSLSVMMGLYDPLTKMWKRWADLDDDDDDSISSLATRSGNSRTAGAERQEYGAQTELRNVLDSAKAVADAENDQAKTSTFDWNILGIFRIRMQPLNITILKKNIGFLSAR